MGLAGRGTRYRAAWVRADLVAGLTTAAVVIPQSMAYAAIAGLPVEVGLYSASVPMVVYALTGTSRALSVSVSSSIAAITAVAIAGTPDPAGAAATLALLSGMVLIAASLARLGFVADLISAPVLAGFKVGVGLSIAAGQLDSLLGVSITSDRFLGQLWQAVTSLGKVQPATPALSTVCVVVLLVGGRWLRVVPPALIVVVAAVAVSWITGLDRYGIALIAPVPSGFPVPGVPPLGVAAELVGPAVGVALVAFVESSAAARTFRRGDDEPLVADRELRALGLAAVASALVRGMPTGGGISQTAVNDGAGARTRLAAVITGAIVVVTLLLLAPLFSHLPQAVLGALVFAAAVGLVDLRTVRTIFVVNRRDGVLSLLAAAGVIALGALDGIVIAVVISALTLLYESSRRPLEVLATVPPDDIDGVPVPAGMIVVRPQTDLHFANVQRFRREVDAAIDAAEQAGRPLSVLLVDAGRVSTFEYTAHQVVLALAAELRQRRVEVWAALPTGALGGAVGRYDAAFGAAGIRRFPTAAAGVEAYTRS